MPPSGRTYQVVGPAVEVDCVAPEVTFRETTVLLEAELEDDPVIVAA